MLFEHFIDHIRTSFPEAYAPPAEEQFRRLEPLYRDWNAKINVISRKDIGELYSHHVLHSLAIAEFLKTRRPEVYAQWVDNKRIVNILDLGTGGGFPGIPLAILFPNCKFTLCDSIGKKIRVASEIAAGLGLTNVKTVNARVESLLEQFDFTVSRAVAPLDVLMSWVKGKYTQGLICLKGGDVLPEISETVRKFRIGVETVEVWPVTNWLTDDYFDGKSVIYVRR